MRVVVRVPPSALVTLSILLAIGMGGDYLLHRYAFNYTIMKSSDAKSKYGNAIQKETVVVQHVPGRLISDLYKKANLSDGHGLSFEINGKKTTVWNMEGVVYNKLREVTFETHDRDLIKVK